MAAHPVAPVLIRASSAVAALLAGWSLNVRWGSSDVRGGPPLQWERLVVGATLLCAAAAIIGWIATRAPAGERTPARLAMRVAASGLGAGAVAIALYLRQDAGDSGLERLLDGPGWLWMTAGAALSMLAAAGSFALRPPPAAAGSRRRSSPRR